MTDLVQELRSRREMRDGGNGNVYDVADEVCDLAADEIERLRRMLEVAMNALSDVSRKSDEARDSLRPFL